MLSSKKHSPEDEAEIQRLISGGDPEYFYDPRDFAFPPKLTAEESAAVDAVLKRTAKKK